MGCQNQIQNDPFLFLVRGAVLCKTFLIVQLAKPKSRRAAHLLGAKLQTHIRTHMRVHKILAPCSPASSVTSQRLKMPGGPWILRGAMYCPAVKTAVGRCCRKQHRAHKRKNPVRAGLLRSLLFNSLSLVMNATCVWDQIKGQ